MSTKYNLLPSASHFMAFSTGVPLIGLHYSYTKSSMYCKCTVDIGYETFTYVERKPLAKDSLELLDSMYANDYVGPARLFDSLDGNERADDELFEAFRGLRMVASERSKLSEELETIEFESEQYHELECQLEFLTEDASDAKLQIEKVINAFNAESGFDPATGFIAPSNG